MSYEVFTLLWTPIPLKRAWPTLSPGPRLRVGFSQNWGMSGTRVKSEAYFGSSSGSLRSSESDLPRATPSTMSAQVKGSASVPRFVLMMLGEEVMVVARIRIPALGEHPWDPSVGFISMYKAFVPGSDGLGFRALFFDGLSAIAIHVCIRDCRGHWLPKLGRPVIESWPLIDPPVVRGLPAQRERKRKTRSLSGDVKAADDRVRVFLHFAKVAPTLPSEIFPKSLVADQALPDAFESGGGFPARMTIIVQVPCLLRRFKG
ncbi:hypothetical protein Bca101_084519 [Brassica carinata]